MKKYTYIIVLLTLVSCSNDTVIEKNAKTVFIQNLDSVVKEKQFCSSIPSGLMVQPQEFVVNPLADTMILLGNKGSKIHIPKNSFRFMNGDIVKSPVIIKVKDYRNAADMAFSEIPMVYKNKSGEEFNFNSAGMFDISGLTLTGEEIAIAPTKSLKVDYRLVHKNNGIDFYKLSKKTKEWSKIQKIERIPKKVKTPDKANDLNFSLSLARDVNCNLWYKGVGKDSVVPLEKVVAEKYKVPASLKKFLDENPQQTISVLFTLDTISGAIENIRADKRNQTKKYDNDLVNLVKELPVCQFSKSKKKSISPFKEVYQLKLHKDVWAERLVSRTDDGELVNRALLHLLGSDREGNRIYDKQVVMAGRVDNRVQYASYFEGGHTYPDIVQNLNVSSFGVYNCDQIYRIQNRVDISALYHDEKGKVIEDLKVLSMVDLAVNGAFSFNPYHFSCNSLGENVLLLFTKDNRFYLLSKENFKKASVSKSGEYTFKMKDVTDLITNSNELANYLGIKT